MIRPTFNVIAAALLLATAGPALSAANNDPDWPCNQLELAARLRKEASEVDAMRGKPDANVNEIAARTDRLTWETRIFEERVQSLTYVCEVPTLIEQRLYALAKTVNEVLKEKQ